VAVEDLLGVVGLGGKVHALAELEDGLLRGRPVAACADDDDALVVGGREQVLREDARDRVGKRRDVLAAERREGRDRARVARRVAVGLLHLGRDDEHVVGGLGERTLLLARHEPDRPGERLHSLERKPRLALVADDDEEVGLGRGERGLQGLDRLAARLRRVEGRPAAGEDDASRGQPPVADALGDSAKPVRLREDRLAGEVAGHVSGESTMRQMEGYRFVRTRDVEFRDVDAADHVNNAVYLTYLETGRIQYLIDVLGPEFAYELSLILAHITVDFRSPARFPETLELGARVTLIGTKSFVMEHEIRGGDGRVVLEASSVLVAYDYEANAPMAVPEDWRARLDAYEERSSVAT